MTSTRVHYPPPLCCISFQTRLFFVSVRLCSIVTHPHKRLPFPCHVRHHKTPLQICIIDWEIMMTPYHFSNGHAATIRSPLILNAHPSPTLYFHPLPLPWVISVPAVRFFLIFHGLETHEIRGYLLHLYTGCPCQEFDVFYHSVFDVIKVLNKERHKSGHWWKMVGNNLIVEHRSTGLFISKVDSLAACGSTATLTML